MAPRRKVFRKVRRRRRRKAKWRQQKLAVGTVQKIARDIAKAEDKKNLKKYVHCSYVTAAGFQSTWPTAAYKRALPSLSNWASHTGSSQDLAIPYQILTRIADNVITPEMKNLDQGEQAQTEVAIHGVQTYGVVCNNSLRPMRFEARLLWIPNLNKYTQAQIDYLLPRFTQFFKSGKGTGNLLFQGYARRGLGALDASGIPTSFRVLARKVLYVPAASWTGTLTGTQNPGTFDAEMPIVFKRFSMAKYFKKALKGYCRADAAPNDVMSNGNIVLVYWSDLPGSSSFNVLITSNVQYSVKANMNDDVGA